MNAVDLCIVPGMDGCTCSPSSQPTTDPDPTTVSTLNRSMNPTSVLSTTAMTTVDPADSTESTDVGVANVVDDTSDSFYLILMTIGLALSFCTCFMTVNAFFGWKVMKLKQQKELIAHMSRQQMQHQMQ